jgi:hypothetical protein
MRVPLGTCGMFKATAHKSKKFYPCPQAAQEPVRILRWVARTGLAGQGRGARRRSMPGCIFDDEQRRDCPQSPCAQRVPAARSHLLRCRASTMRTDIACGAAPCTWPHDARNAAHCNIRTGSWIRVPFCRQKLMHYTDDSFHLANLEVCW